MLSCREPFTAALQINWEFKFPVFTIDFFLIMKFYNFKQHRLHNKKEPFMILLPSNILVMENEYVNRKKLENILRFAHRLDFCDNTRDVLVKIETQKYNMILIDIRVPDSILLAKNIYKDIPVVFLTSYREIYTFDEVFNLYAYGVVIKPFSAKKMKIDLHLAYNSFLTQRGDKDNREIIVINKNYHYSKSLRTLYCNKKPVILPPKLAHLVDILCQMHNRVIKAEVLKSKVWGEHVDSDNILRSNISRLRQLLPDLPIVTYSKIGYALLTEEPTRKKQ